MAGVPSLTAGAKAELLLRPESLRLALPGEAAEFQGRIAKCAFVGASQHCEIALPDGGTLKLTAPPNAQVAVGQQASVAMDRDQAWLMPGAAP